MRNFIDENRNDSMERPSKERVKRKLFMTKKTTPKQKAFM